MLTFTPAILLAWNREFPYSYTKSKKRLHKEELAHAYRANLLPEDKIAIVKAYQAKGHTVSSRLLCQK